jgi:hypothetical protein
MLARRHKNSGKQNVGVRFDSHRAWIRGHVCAVQGDGCGGKIECAHIEGSGTGGIGMKAADWATIPMCHDHHAERHRRGWRTFDRQHDLDALALAKSLAARSPHIQRAAREAGYTVDEQEHEA